MPIMVVPFETRLNRGEYWPRAFIVTIGQILYGGVAASLDLDLRSILARFLAVLLFLFVLCTVSEATAKSVRLDNSEDESYMREVLSLESGDSVTFRDGRTFQLGKYLGGNITRVFALDENKVIRIPLSIQFGGADGSYLKASSESVNRNYIELYKELKPTGLHLVEVFLNLSNLKEYVIVKRLYPRFTYEEFQKDSFLAWGERSKIWSQLYEFAETTFRFRTIGDFKPDQLVYTDIDGWVLIDWMDHYFSYTREWNGEMDARTVFDPLKKTNAGGRNLPFPMSLWHRYQVHRRIGEKRRCAQALLGRQGI